jgi:chromosome segregation ATPase
MSEISEFETRIKAALERIGHAVVAAEEKNADSPQGGIALEEMTAEMGHLNEALEAERDTNAKLEERVRAIHERQESHVTALEADVAQLREQLAAHDAQVQKLRGVTAQLRANNAELRAANEKSVGDQLLVDAAMKAELEAINVEREAEAAELKAILSDLRPFVQPAQKEEA